MSPPTFSSSTTAEEVATAFADQIKGKNVLITGTSLNGIGFEAARVLAKHANLIIITGYNLERLKLSEDAIKQEVPSANIRRLALDLSSLSAVRKAAAEINAYSEPIHVLIHNAAAAIAAFKLTVDNLESQIATDHFGPFLLTKLIAPKILASSVPGFTPRVVHFVHQNLRRNMAEKGCRNLDDPAAAEASAYFQAKSANILTAIELSKRSKGRINAYSLHPGVIHTNITAKEESLTYMQEIVNCGEGLINAEGGPDTVRIENWKTIPQGAATTVAAAFDPRLNDVPGAYLDDCIEANSTIASHSSDPATAENLWGVTEEIIGEKFTF
ncbi:hypothetical protein C8R47DRAFT_1063073 [Mycena vitilis]|nr:hypothetical protein C8R47DRAFT_1063073 [Mycena vitilis]